ncbi:MAG: type II toxin-antitoxin system VapB family antitoxin [Planctomycetes bacterium]|nr:type II toxin-antitoxin system VapB family antitoxin [Planctomycetota bacterium]
MKRTNIEINDELAKKGMEISGATTYKEIVNIALQDFVKRNSQKKLLKYFGSNVWEGNLSTMRATR